MLTNNVDESQLALFADISSELDTAHSVQDFCNQFSIWTYNALVHTSAFIDRESNADLILRLTQASREADAIKADADALVASLREEKRTLALTVGAHINSKEMKRARKEAEKHAKANAKALEAEAKAIEEADSEPTQTQPAQTQPVKSMRKSKTQLVAEATNA